MRRSQSTLPMKRSSFLHQSILVAAAGALALAPNAHASPIVNSTVFAETLVVETDLFETPGGTILFTTNGVGYSDWLSPIIAADLAGDPSIPSQIQATAALVALASEYQFLADQGPTYIVLGGVGPPILDPFADQNIGLDVGYSPAAAAGSAYSIVGPPIVTTIGTWSYSTAAIEPDGSILQGTVNLSGYNVNIIEQPAPEPSTLPLLALSCFAWRKAAGGSR